MRGPRSARARPWAVPPTEVIELVGATLNPGLVDGRTHPLLSVDQFIGPPLGDGDGGKVVSPSGTVTVAVLVVPRRCA
jgi:hypothetical protein